MVAISRGGMASPAARLNVSSSPALPRRIQLPKLDEPARGNAAPKEDGRLRVWALPGLVKIGPLAGDVLANDLGTERAGVPPRDVANAAWNGEQVRLFGAG